ncbi:MAG TPA: hypothetical protein DCO83_17275 [Mucilaginibacter sp.]|jgi:hypothetical protein|nr:hypothetical protein [Mucilaginibacter sp.]
METHQIQNLLHQVNAITTRYKKINELTGENFNVFRILKLESSEVRMHSAFIAELLKPDGSHGQKDTFLKLFVNAFCFNGNLIDTQSCKVKVEEGIGAIREEGTQGGRIDIVITDKHYHQIIIENKIYAGDQDHQLTRYHKYSDKADIIYLTLDGKPPSDNSKGEMEDGVHYKCYSYKHDILNWLELCRKEVTINPIVREALTHYINLIKYLTNQTLNQTMQEELSDLLKSNLEASFAIADNLDKACDKVSNDFGEIIEKACMDIGLECAYGISFNKNYSGIWIWRPEWKYVNIGIQFQNYDKDLVYGVSTKKNPNDFPIPTTVRDKIKSLPHNTPKNNAWWPWFKRLGEPYNNWSKFQAWEAISDGRMKDHLMDRIQYLIELTKGLEM